jgi:Spy/CpxP family protein refolding chaperone
MTDTTLRHPITGDPIVPVGYRRNGAPIWPILGAAEDNSDADGDDTADEGSDTGDDGEQDGDEGDAGTDDGTQALGDAGKKALDKMKAERNAARREAREARRALEAATAAAKPAEGDQPDAAAIEAEADRKATAKANQRILRAEVKVAAAGKLTDPSDALRLLDLTQFEVDDDGNVDEDEIAEAIDDLISKKPYLAAAQGGRRFQGGADGGSRKGNKPPTLDERLAEAQAKGDTRTFIALQNQRLAESAGKS